MVLVKQTLFDKVRQQLTKKDFHATQNAHFVKFEKFRSLRVVWISHREFPGHSLKKYKMTS